MADLYSDPDAEQYPKCGEVAPPIITTGYQKQCSTCLHIWGQVQQSDITLITDFDEGSGFYYFVVKEGDETLHFRPGFRTREEAERIGDLWIQERLGASPKEK